MSKPALEIQVGGDHYKVTPLQPWDVVAVLARRRAKLLLLAVDEADTIDEARNLLAGALEDFYYEGDQVKYIMRDGTKKGAETDHDKAVHYGHQRLDNMSTQQMYIATERNLSKDPEVLTAFVKKEVAEVAAKLIQAKGK